jgi:hypothetical protein
MPVQVALIVPLMVGTYFIQRVYSAGTIVIRAKEAAARKPALTVAADVLSGLQTLQAFGQQGLVEAQMRRAVRSGAAWYMSFIASERDRLAACKVQSTIARRLGACCMPTGCCRHCTCSAIRAQPAPAAATVPILPLARGATHSSPQRRSGYFCVGIGLQARPG